MRNKISQSVRRKAGTSIFARREYASIIFDVHVVVWSIEATFNNIYMTNGPRFYIKVQKRVNLGTPASEVVQFACFMQRRVIRLRTQLTARAVSLKFLYAIPTNRTPLHLMCKRVVCCSSFIHPSQIATELLFKMAMHFLKSLHHIAKRYE